MSIDDLLSLILSLFNLKNEQKKQKQKEKMGMQTTGENIHLTFHHLFVVILIHYEVQSRSFRVSLSTDL